MEQNYLKLIILFFDIGNSALRKFLEEKLQDAGHSCFTDLLEKEKHKFYHCLEPRNICCCKSNNESSKSLIVEQWNLLYVDSGGSSTCRHRGKHPCKYIAKGDVRLEDLDFTLLRLIIDKLFPGNSDVENIRELRNNIIHSSAVSVEEDEFNRQWKSSIRSIFNLSKDSNGNFLKEIRQRVDQLATRTLESGAYETLLKMIRQWKEDNSTEMTSFKRKAESIENIVLSMKTRVESLETIVESTETNMKSIVTDVQSLKAQGESTKTRVESVETNIQSMKAERESMKTNMKSIATDVQSVKAQGESTKTRVESVETNIQSMKAERESMKTNMKSIATDVQSVKAQGESMKTRVESVETNIQSMKAERESMKTNMKSIATDIQSMKADSGRQKEANLKTSRHRCIKRGIENTECELRTHRKSFYVPLGAAEEKAYKRLLEKHLVTISGRAGSGKSSLGKQLLIKYCDEHTEADGSPTYTPVIISKPDDFGYISCKDRLLIFIDDPFGKSNFDDKLLKEWEIHFEKLSSYCNEGNTRIIIGVRSNMISDPKETFRNFNLFSKENIIDLSSEHILTSQEKLHMLHAYCKKCKVQISGNDSGLVSRESVSSPNEMADTNIHVLSSKIIQKCVLSEISELDLFEGFPLACSRFFACQSWFNQGAKFFTHAAKKLEEEISQLKTKDPILYFTLSYMLLEGGNIGLHNIDENKLSKMNESFGQNCSREDIKNCCKCEKSQVYIEKEQYIKHSRRGGKHFKFTHQTVMEAVLLSLFDGQPELILKHSNYQIIEEFVRPSGYNQWKDEICVKVDSRYDTLLAERVVSKSHYLLLFYRGVSDAKFVEDLLDELEKIEKLSGRRKCLPKIITELLRTFGIYRSPLLRAICNRYTYNGRKCVTKRTKLKLTLKPFTSQNVKSKQALIELDKFLSVLNDMLKENVNFVEELIMSCELSDPMIEFKYSDGNEDRTIVPMFYAADKRMEHLIFFWMKKSLTIKGHYLRKRDILYQILDMCCKSPDIVEILIHNDKHGKREKELSPPLVYDNATELGRKMVRIVLQSNSDVTRTDMSDNTLLLCCSRYGLNSEVVKMLESHLDIIDLRSNDEETAIIMMAKHRETDNVNEMLQNKKNNIDNTLTDNDGNTFLHYFARNGLKTGVLEILKIHPELVNVQNNTGKTAIFLAAMCRQSDIVQVLLQHGEHEVDLTLTDNDGNNLLHHCCKSGLKTEVLMILEKYPEIGNVQNKFGQTAIMVATISRKTDILQVLLQHRESNIDITIADNDGNTLLHHCCRSGLKTEVLLILETHPEIVNVQNEYGQTAIFLAVIYRKTDIVQELLQERKSKIDITLSDVDGYNLLQQCCRYGLYTEVLIIMKKHPEIVNVQHKYGETAIIMAATQGQQKTVNEMLQFKESNIDISLSDNGGFNLLHHCCRYGLKPEVLMILETHPEIVNVQNKDGVTAIMMAAVSRETGIVQGLLQHRESNIDIALTDKNGNTVLHYCCRYGFKREVLMILESHPGIFNIQNKNGETAIIMAAMSRETEIVNELLRHRKNNIDITLADNDGNNLLHHCCIYGLKTEVLWILETHPGVVNIQNKNGQTAIFLAVISRKTEIVQELLQHRKSIIDITLTDKDGNTLLHYCSRRGLKTAVLMILETHPGVVNVQNKNGQTAIFLAVISRKTEIVQELLQHRKSIIDITLTDKDGNNVLHCCSRKGLKTVLMILETHPEIVNVQNKDGETAIIMAAKHGKEKTVNVMLQHRENNIDITLADNDGNNLLHHCCKNGLKKEVLMILKTHPEIVNAQNRNGETAIFLAAMSRKTGIVDVLLQHREDNFDLSIPHNDHETLLHYCCSYGLETEALMILETHPEIVNVQNKYGQTAIIVAAIYREEKILSEMLQHKESNIDITLPDKDGNTLLHHCCLVSFKTEVLLILETHPDIVNVQNQDGETFINMAVKHCRTDTLNELLRHRESNVDIALPDNYGNTVLHNCCKFGFKTEVLTIMKIHPEMGNVQNKDGQTAIMIAALSMETDIVQELLQYRKSILDITLTDKDGNNVLHYCSRRGLKTVLMILETHPEIVNVQNKAGETAIIMAAKHGKEKTVNEMLQHRENNIDFTLADNDGNNLLHHCCKNGLKTEVLLIMKKHPELVNIQNKDGNTAMPCSNV